MGCGTGAYISDTGAYIITISGTEAYISDTEAYQWEWEEGGIEAMTGIINDKVWCGMIELVDHISISSCQSFLPDHVLYWMAGCT